MTFDEARVSANVNARARRLFEGGYRARWRSTHVLEVRSPQGAAYGVDVLAGTCDCPFFQGHDGRLWCKHSLGWRQLLVRQRAARRRIALLLLLCWADLDDARPCVSATPAAETEAADASA